MPAVCRHTCVREASPLPFEFAFADSNADGVLLPETFHMHVRVPGARTCSQAVRSNEVATASKASRRLSRRTCEVLSPLSRTQNVDCVLHRVQVAKRARAS